MFIQVIEARVGDLERLREQEERWQKELMPGADGFLGSSSGVTADGMYVAIARFASEEAARANSRRSEQDAWWEETASCFEGEVLFRDTSDVEVLGEGGSDGAGFVQVIIGQASDRERLKVLAGQIMPSLMEQRPDLLGSVRAWHDNAEFTEFAYFTSEPQARIGEAMRLPTELQQRRDEASALMTDLRFLDLRETWLISP